MAPYSKPYVTTSPRGTGRARHRRQKRSSTSTHGKRRQQNPPVESSDPGRLAQRFRRASRTPRGLAREFPRGTRGYAFVVTPGLRLARPPSPEAACSSREAPRLGRFFRWRRCRGALVDDLRRLRARAPCRAAWWDIRPNIRAISLPEAAAIVGDREPAAVAPRFLYRTSISAVAVGAAAPCPNSPTKSWAFCTNCE